MAYSSQRRQLRAAAAKSGSQREGRPSIIDQRPSAAAQLRRKQQIDKLAPSRPISQLITDEEIEGAHPAQMMEDEEETLQEKFTDSSPAQLVQAQQSQPNNTGLPDNLKAGIENLSGMSMDHVKVHYNSGEPAQLNAHAYAQGSDIHVAPGQERHLPHEAWHVVQQAQGRVAPTRQMKGSVEINDDVGLEREADVMGAKALTTSDRSPAAPMVEPSPLSAGAMEGIAQRIVINAAAAPKMLADVIDTTNLAASEQLLRDIADAGRIGALHDIRQILQHQGVRSGMLEPKTNDEILLDLVTDLFEDGPRVDDREPMGFLEKRRAVGAVDGLGGVDPALVAAINIWVVGAPATGIGWSALGNHMRGMIDAAGYRQFGVMVSLQLPAPAQVLLNQMPQPGLDLAYEQMGQAALDAAQQTLTNGLGQLPDFNGTSYRRSALANQDVFSQHIHVGDHIRDEAFWSTSIFRGGGAAAAGWGDMGTQQHPVAYFVIHGQTGKYIQPYSQIQGEQEVLFQPQATFQVERIVNFNRITYFVYLQETPAPGLGTPVFNPFNGQQYP